ncbi:MAG TPA: hypothetical protein VM282_02130 [Acidimicrobiales bacterium]|nr:hypothetical protein [Acidimicrobiales bacterium]
MDTIAARSIRTLHVIHPAHELCQVEAGTVELVDLPDELAWAFAQIPSASLFLMADLESRMSRR